MQYLFILNEIMDIPVEFITGIELLCKFDNLMVNQHRNSSFL